MRQILLVFVVLGAMVSLLVGTGAGQQAATQSAQAVGVVRGAWYGQDEKVQEEEDQGGDADKKKKDKKKEKDDTVAKTGDGEKKGEAEEEITLERLFPEKSFFGPSADSMTFSTDGKFAAYLYRPYVERRHGSDLWIYDVASGETKRITSVSVMAKFQEATRKVKEDRLNKAKKKRKGKGAKSKRKGDGITGEWHGILTGPAEFDIPPEGVAFILSLELDDEEKILSGTFRSAVADATVTKGEWDKKKKIVSCTLVDPDSGLTGALTGKINDEDLMEGAIVTENPEATFQFTAMRKKTADEGGGKGEDAQQKDVGETGHKGADDHADRSNGNADDKNGEKVEDDEHGDSENGEMDDDDEDGRLIDEVDEKDADDEKAPRYGGISSFQWAPEKNELLMISGGDIYLYVVEGDDAGEITRLIRSKERESGVQYLPDGSGYTVRRSNGVLKVMFGSHLVEQIDPAFPAGEEMTSYKLSPDGKRVAFVTSKGKSFWGAGRQVNIVNYRSRFAQVKTVSRHMSDDPRPTVEHAVYLYQINDSMFEDGQLDKVYGYSSNSPRDALTGPEWALDSSRIVFMRYSQSENMVRILEASYPEPNVDDDDDEKVDDAEDGKGAVEEDAGNVGDEVEKGTDEEDAQDDDADAAADAADDADDADDDNDGDEAEEKKPDVIKAGEAKIVYQFSHNGGPNTPGLIHPHYLPDNRRIAMITELTGFRHLHILDPTYEQLDQITHGRFEVYPLRISKDHRYLFATATKEHPSQLDVYRINLESGEMTRLDQMDGTYSGVAVSNDGKHVLANFVDYGRLRELVAINVSKENGQRTLTDSHPDEAKKLTKPIPESFSYENRYGQTIYGQMFKPDDWTPQDKRPLLIYVYGGPLGTQKMVTRGSYSSDSYFFAYYMAKKHGYVTCTIDPRGASGYGGLFEKSNYEQVGKPQVEDLVDGARWFIKNQGVDAKKVGIHGWSFGGFQTQMCMYTEPDVFAVGMAGAGPTEWENYNSWYSTGTIGPSREGKADLAKFSLLPLAKNLKGKLLLAHGMEDSNVLYQDTVRVYRELLKAGKETNVELFLDPTGGHGLGGDIKRIGRMRKYEDFLLRTLGEGKSAKSGADGGDEKGSEQNAENSVDDEKVKQGGSG